MKSAIYTGTVTHSRITPRAHSFHYRLFMMYLDLDELPSIFKKSWLWSLERANLASFRRRDYHGGIDNSTLKEAVLKTVFDKTGVLLTGPVRLLTHLRYFGFVFNPVSFYFCFDEKDKLRAILSEIENTPWGERHSYVFLTGSEEGAPPVTHRCRFQKEFHVSPFMPMGIEYHWSFSEPDDRLLINMLNLQDGAKTFHAGLNLEKKEITASALNRVLWSYPIMTFKVVFGIYYQALRLYLKKIPFFEHPKGAL